MPTGESSNRVLWTIRALLALIAVVLLALVVHQATGRTTSSDWLKLTAGNGRTAQGTQIAMRFDRPAHPLAFATQVHARCGDGSSRAAHWAPFDGTAVPFRRQGRGLRVVEISDRTHDDGAFGQIVFSMAATVGPGARQVRGWVRMTAAFSRADGTGTRCDSGRVPFAVGATSARPS
jgi:hypothetical protein